MDLVLAFRDLKSMYFGTNIFAPVATVLMIFMKKLPSPCEEICFLQNAKTEIIVKLLGKNKQRENNSPIMSCQ